MKAFAGVCLKLLLLLCLFFSANLFAAGWPEFNPQSQSSVTFYCKEANKLCVQMEDLRNNYHKRASDLSSKTPRNPLFGNEIKWFEVWRACSKDEQNRKTEMQLSLKSFGDRLIAELKDKRAELKKKGNAPFSRDITAKAIDTLRSVPKTLYTPLKIGSNTWHLPTAIPTTCTESPEKGIPTRKTPHTKNSNMVRLGLGKAPWVYEILHDGEKKYHYAEAHHMSQNKNNENIMFLSFGTHKKYGGILHGTLKESKIDRRSFADEKKFAAKFFAARLTLKWLERLMQQWNPPPLVPAAPPLPAVTPASPESVTTPSVAVSDAAADLAVSKKNKKKKVKSGVDKENLAPKVTGRAKSLPLKQRAQRKGLSLINPNAVKA